VLDLLHAEPMGERGVDVEGLPATRRCFSSATVDGADVVEPVGQLDDEDPQVLGHGHHHLADGGRLGLFPGVVLDRSSLVTPSIR
jgi:hypothetical protein